MVYSLTKLGVETAWVKSKMQIWWKVYVIFNTLGYQYKDKVERNVVQKIIWLDVCLERHTIPWLSKWTKVSFHKTVYEPRPISTCLLHYSLKMNLNQSFSFNLSKNFFEGANIVFEREPSVDCRKLFLFYLIAYFIKHEWNWQDNS